MLKTTPVFYFFISLFMFKKILLIFLCLLLGGIFIFSALAKLYPIEPFEYTFVDIGIANWTLAPFVARFFIGLEFLIGALFVLNIKIKTTSKISLASLLLFSAYLFGLILFEGNKGNCGCFGQYFPMTPGQALIKNAILLLLIGLVYKYYDSPTTNRWRKMSIYLFYIMMPVSFILPHILNYVDLDYTKAYLSPKKDHYKLELDTLYKYAEINEPPKNLSQGKHILAFMSLTCPHCKIAAKKMKIISERNHEIPFFFILNGDEEMILPFFEDTKAKNIPYCFLLGKGFVFLAGINMPAIYLVNNGIVENSLSYFSLDQEQIEEWLNYKK